MQGVTISKVFLSIEDHTAWALTEDHKVYYKRENDAEFKIYPLTSNLKVKEITGCN